jgi:hypothetical protein
MDRKLKDSVNGLKVEVKSLNLNVGLYKEVSGKVIIRATKRAMKRKGGVSVFLRNTYYYGDPSLDPHLNEVAIPPGVFTSKAEAITRNERRTVLREFAFGLGGISGELPQGGVNPGPGVVALPIIGVRTEATINVGDQNKRFETAAGVVFST